MPENEYKTAFADLVFDITREDISDKEFQGIMKIINRLIWDRKEPELLELLKFHFPEYCQQNKPDKLK